MKFRSENLVQAFAIFLIATALAVGFVYLFVEEKTLPVQNGKISVIDTFETDTSMKAVPDSLPRIEK